MGVGMWDHYSSFVFNTVELALDEFIASWSGRWETNATRTVFEMRRLVQELMRYGMGEDKGVEIREHVYCFCEEEWIEIGTVWYCWLCKKCIEDSSWHCGECGKCTAVSHIFPCEGCGGLSEFLKEERTA